MREVFFRGKQKDNNEWIEGYYAVQSNHACFAHELKYTHFIFKDIFLDFNLGGLQEFEVTPETVGQYTGLIDKNGKRIFEGDIIKADNGHIGFVTFHNGSFVKCCFCHVGSINDIYGDNETVIGNKYDNPELLKSGEYIDKIQ